MECIRGQSLREYIGAHHLDTSARLELIAKVCDAVHHAHQRSLIHRDLKPGNILVDEAGQPKVLDFGVARVTDSDAQATLHTHVGEIVGTLAYMSPEQVLADPLEIDARSDVYSLGVILYEVLADRLPYEVSRKIHEAVTTIREKEPARLSAVQRLYRGDIETIAAKALEKDRSHRYASAASMAEDIRRCLRDEPIVARPPSAGYQLQKLVRRHRTLSIGLAAVAIVLTVGILVSTWQARRATRAEQSVARERDRATSAESLSQPMPTDPAIAMGEFPNGLRYYVRANKTPAKRAELRLVVKAGSILEDDDQQGLAHFVEHMAFNGTQHFPKNEMTAFIQSLGMRFGGDLNASTSFNETIFMLKVPTDDPNVVDRALLVLEDWAHNVSFDNAEIDRERGVVLDEWRLRQAASGRMADQVFPILLRGSYYATRIPIGKPDIIKSFAPERLKQFYKDWYRPDLMAVVAVGDFDRDAVQNLVKAHFAAIPPPAVLRPRASYDVDRPGTVYAVVADREATSTTIEIDHLLPVRTPGTIGVYRQGMVDHLVSGMLTARLSELAQQPQAPFISGSAGRGAFITPTKDSTSLGASVKADGIERGLDALVAEKERVTRFGFTATELERQKESLLRNAERFKVEDESRLSASRADEYIRSFLRQETLPGGPAEYELYRRLLPQISPDEVNKSAREWFPERNRLVIVEARDAGNAPLPDEQTLSAVMAAASARDLKPYVDTVSALALLDSVPTPGRVVNTSTKDAGITEWALSNGVKVVLKPTTFKQDEILFQATKPGGTSLASDQDYIPASNAVQVVTAGGLGKLNAVDLKKVLTGKLASVTPFISELEEGLRGTSSPKDLETLFQLIYLRFTQPRRDETAFSVWLEQMKSQLASQMASPSFTFSEALSTARFQGHLRRRPQTASDIEAMSLDRSLAFYKDRFSDASGFTFVFVGSFDPATLRPLVERYVGGLPSLHGQETWKDVGVRNATSVIEKRIEKGTQPQTRTAIVFSGPFEYDQVHRVAIRSMADVLQTRLLQTIREALGGTYSISATATYQKAPNPEYSVGIDFGADPLRADELIKRVFQEIEKLKAMGPTDIQVADERAALRRDFETNSQMNSYLLTQISFKYQQAEDAAGLWRVPEYYAKVDTAMIQQAARTYLDTRRYVKVSMFSEKK